MDQPPQYTDENIAPPDYEQQQQQPPPYQETNEQQMYPDMQQQEQQQTYEQPQTYEPQQQQQQTYEQPRYPEEPEDVVQQPTGGTGGESSGNQTRMEKFKVANYTDGDGFFGPRMRRLLTHGGLLVFFGFMAFDLWFDTKESPLGDLKNVDKALDTSFQDGWNLHAGGLFFMFVGFVGVLVVQILAWREVFEESKIVNLIVAAVIWLGAFLYWVGGAVVAGSYNDLKNTKGKTAAAGIYFGEATFVGLVGVSLGLDLLFNFHSKSKRIRIYLIFGIILALGSLILFFSYATVYKKGMKAADESAVNTVAAGYFFLLIALIVLFVLEFALHSHSMMELYGGLIWLASIGFFLFGGFLTAIGYWALCDYRATPKDARSGQNAYWVGYSFLLLGLCVIEAIDIKLHEFLPFGKVADSESGGGGDVAQQQPEPTME